MKICQKLIVLLAFAAIALLSGCTSPARDAKFDRPHGIAINRDGHIYVADTFNAIIREITPSGMVRTLAGKPGVQGFDDGTGDKALFHSPYGITVDSAGIIYVADGNAIRKVTPSGEVSTLAGSMTQKGSVDGRGGSARFDGVTGLAVDRTGNLYVADFNNNTVRKVSPVGMVSTLAGTPGASGRSVDGRARTARFSHLRGLTIDGASNVYVAENRADTGPVIRRIAPDGTVTTLPIRIGNTMVGPYTVEPNYEGIASDGVGNLYVADKSQGTRILKFSPDGGVSTLVSSPKGTPTEDGIGKWAKRYHPLALTVGESGEVYFTTGSTVRKVTASGAEVIVAGSDDATGFADSP